jgi:ribosome recycling factor
MVIADLKKSTDQKMDKSVQAFKADLAKVRTGRAHTGILDHVMVDYYGSATPINQVAKVTLLDSRTIGVTPFEKKLTQAIEKAIRESDLGLNPANDGHVVRLAFPALTEERRKELVRLVRHMAEEGKVALRNLRRSARHELESLERAGDLREDDLKRAEKELDDMIHAHESTLGGALADNPPPPPEE